MNILSFFIIIQINPAPEFYETQIPFDSLGRIKEINAELAAQISFFKDYPEMERAILYLGPDSSYTLEIFSKRNGNIIKQRIDILAEVVIQIREEIEQVKSERRLSVFYDRSGYTNFLGNSFLFSYAFQSPLIVAGIKPSDYYTGTAIYMLSSAAGFFVPLILTQNCDVTKAHASMFGYGGIHGGYIAGSLVELADLNFYEGPGALATVAGSIMGEYLGFNSVNKYHLRLGRANTIGTVADFCGVSTVGLLALIDDWSRPIFNYKHYLLTSIGGIGGGLLLGGIVTRELDLADGDPGIFGICGMLGVATLPTVILWADGEYPGDRISGKIYISAGLAGLGLGSYLGYKTVRNKNFNEREANIISLGGMAGALVSTGFVYLTKVDNPKVYITAGIAGEILGILITSSTIYAGSKEGHSRIKIHPEGLCYLLSSVSHINIPGKGSIVSFTF